MSLQNSLLSTPLSPHPSPSNYNSAIPILSIRYVKIQESHTLSPLLPSLPSPSNNSAIPMKETKIDLVIFFPGQIPIVQLNFAALSFETPFDRDNVESCVKEVLQALSRSIQAKRNVEFHFTGMGRLSFREGKVKMKFYKDFVKSMDGTGNLIRALSNVSFSYH